MYLERLSLVGQERKEIEVTQDQMEFQVTPGYLVEMVCLAFKDKKESLVLMGREAFLGFQALQVPLETGEILVYRVSMDLLDQREQLVARAPLAFLDQCCHLAIPS